MPIGPTGDRTVDNGDVLFGMMDERKYAICRVTGDALRDRSRKDRILGAPIDLFERYELEIYEAANRKYDLGDIEPGGAVTIASSDLQAVIKNG